MPQSCTSRRAKVWRLLERLLRRVCRFGILFIASGDQNHVFGGAGNDSLTGQGGSSDVLNGGDGIDTAGLKVGSSNIGDGTYANLSLGFATSGPSYTNNAVLYTNHIILIDIENLAAYFSQQQGLWIRY
jgi:Ca2+-binding RTX toxin-like protein